MTTQMTTAATVTAIGPELLARWLESGEAVLIDVREDFEFTAERIGPARNYPLSSFDPCRLRGEVGDRRVVFCCRSGRRSAEAARLYHTGEQPTFHLEGGLQAWVNANYPTIRTPGAPRIDVLRQTQLVIGGIVLAGTLLGAFVSPWFLLLSGFMGAGLIFAGASGTCGLALLLARMPWNRSGPACSREA